MWATTLHFTSEQPDRERVPLQVISNNGQFPLLGTALLMQRVLHIDYAEKELSLK